MVTEAQRGEKRDTGNLQYVALIEVCAHAHTHANTHTRRADVCASHYKTLFSAVWTGRFVTKTRAMDVTRGFLLQLLL